MKKFFVVLLIFFARQAGAQSLAQLCDSVFNTLKYGSYDSISKFLPGYKTLRGTYDTMEIEKQEFQVVIVQKRVQISMRKSFKNFLKEAERMNFDLKKMQLDEMRHLILNQDSFRHSFVEADCRQKDKGAIIYFSTIELNGVWYLGDEIRIAKREIEPEPDYEKIDRMAEQRKEKRERKYEKLERKAEQQAEKEKKQEEQKAYKDSVQRQKHIADSLKAEKKALQLAKKDSLAHIKQVNDSLKTLKKQEAELEKKKKAEEKKQKEAGKKRRADSLEQRKETPENKQP